MNKVQLRSFGDPLFLAGELIKIFSPIKTYDEDRYESLHLHNDLWKKIESLVGKNDTEFRFRIARMIYEYGVKQNAEEENKEKNRRTVTGQEGSRRTVTGKV